MRQLGELEAVIMDRLWEWGRPALVREVLDDLRKDRPLAYTTVLLALTPAIVALALGRVPAA